MDKKKSGFALRINEEITNLFKNYGKPKRFSKGEAIVKQGEYSGHVYIILSGDAEVVRIDKFGNENRLALISAGDIVGEMGAFLNNVRSATVRAVSEALVALECPNQMFIRGLFNTHELTYRVLTNYAERINSLNISVSSHYQARLMLVVGHYIMPRLDKTKESQVVELSIKEINGETGLENEKITEALYNFKALKAVEKLVFPAEINIVEISVSGQNVGDEDKNTPESKTVDVELAEPDKIMVTVCTERFTEQMRRVSYV